MISVLAGALGLAVGLVIGTLGGGGGVLAVPALVYVLGQDARTATTSSIVIVGVIATAGVLARARTGTVDWRTGLAFGVIGVPAAWAGSLLNRAVPQPVLLLSFAVLTLAVAVFMIVGNRTRLAEGDPAPDAAPASGASGRAVAVADRAPARPSPRLRAVRVAVAAVVVGFLTGFLGVGGGFLVVPALTLVLGLPMPSAIGTSLLVIGLNSASSLVARLAQLQLDWDVVVPFTVIAIAGALAGKVVADRLSSATLTRAFALLLVAVGVFVGIESIVSMSGL